MDEAPPSTTDTMTTEDPSSERRERRDQLLSAARAATGFMPDDEGEALYLAALRAGASFDGATFMEIGAWCGKSSVYLGAAAEETGAILFSLDHHHGSEENQAGWEHHDSTLVDPETGRIDTLPRWRRTLVGAGPGGVGDRDRRGLAHRRVPLVDTVGLLLHRRGPRRRAGLGRLPGLGAQRDRRRVVGHPRRVPRSRPTAGALPTTSGGPPSNPRSSSRTASAAPCGSCGGSERDRPARSPVLSSVPACPGPAWPARPGRQVRAR